MILFQHPEALLLIPVWLIAAWQFPSAQLFKPLRIAVMLAVVLAWLNPSIDRQGKGVDLWVMVDRSLSVADQMDQRFPEIHALLEQSRGAHDRLRYVDFAGDVIERDPLQHSLLSGRLDASHIGSALHFTLSRLNPRRASRLLLITDGYATEPINDAAARLLAQPIPMDIRLLSPPDDIDYRVDLVTAPLQVRPGDPFIVEARISGSGDAEIPCVLARDGVPIARSTARLQQGVGRVRWTDSIAQPSAAEYTVTISPEVDAWPGNNQKKTWVEARGGQRVVLVTAYENDPVADALSRQGLAVDVMTDTRRLQPGHLAGAAAILLNNVPAYALSEELLAGLPFFVRESGGGLIMIGGKNSFAAGGYFESPIDELLPVSMELKEEHRRLAVAMAIVMDRSGSMTAGVSGAGGKNKMDLANEGAARAIELLGENDAITVFAVDSEPHRIVPLTTLGDNRGKVLNLVRRIQSAGGGIFVYVGLKAGWDELKAARQGQRHVILFSDAADSEQPQGFEQLVDEMVASGASLSVIALGTEKDADADLLKRIAARAGGRIFFNADANTLPAVFAQETVALGRSAFLTDPTVIIPQAGWLETAADMLAWPPQVDGYNLSYLRPEATASLLAGDEYEAPLLAQWTRGLGKVAAVTFPMGGEYSRSMRAWSQYGDFIRTLTRWTMREDVPPGLALRSERMGETVRLELHYDETWNDTWAEAPPRLVVSVADGDGTLRHSWRRIRPGVFEASLTLAGDEVVRGAIQAGRHVIPFGPLAGTIGAEWQFDPALPGALQQLAEASGGQVLFDLADTWRAPVRRELRGVRDVLLIVALSLFLVEALLARIANRSISIGKSEKKRRAITRPRTNETMEKEIKDRTEPVTEAPIPSRKSIFDKARHRGRL